MAGGWFQLDELIVQPEVRDWCCRAYPLHLHGCPNYANKKGCPPAAPLIGETLDLDQPLWVIYNVFDFGAHVSRMRSKHADWSERQVRCCLYWQGTARKQLRGLIKRFNKESYGHKVVGCPEAQGVNLTETMALHGHDLEWPPETKAYQIVIAGVPRRRDG